MKSLRLPWHQRLLIAAGIGIAAAGAGYSQLFWQLDDALYDRLVGGWDYPADPQLVIIAIDEHSLQQLGQWPWPRSTHAQLLDRLSEAGVTHVAMDLMFPEPDRKDATQDAELAAAIRRNGTVVLPVLAASPRPDAVPEELLPIPALAGAAATLAHSDIEVEGDGVARGIYLKAGLGAPRWPALGLALANTGGPLVGVEDAHRTTPSPYRWYRDNYVRLRYAGPPGSFPQASYADVLAGDIPDGLLRGRRVIVGMTASGIAPRLLTPTSAENWMSGSEYQANVASMLLGNRAIVPLSAATQATISALLAVACFLLLALPRPLRVAITAIPLTLLLTITALWGFNLWWAPAAAALAIAMVLAAWAATQVIHWRRHANRDPLTGLGNRRRFEEQLQLQHGNCRRQGKPLTLILIDVDHFKQYNDAFGHHHGDQVLQQVANLMAKHARRPGDLAARFGGDEFAMVLPDTSREGALHLVETLIDQVRRMTVIGNEGQFRHVSISVGLYTAVPDLRSEPRHFSEGADAALYSAKAAGRDGYFAGPAEAV